MKSFYSSFLLRLRWDRDRGILGGEIQKVQTSGEQPAPVQSFRGLDINRIAEFMTRNLGSPETSPDGGDERDDE